MALREANKSVGVDTDSVVVECPELKSSYREVEAWHYKESL